MAVCLQDFGSRAAFWFLFQFQDTTHDPFLILPGLSIRIVIIDGTVSLHKLFVLVLI